MTTLILKGYDAFTSVGIDDETARKAAGELSDSPKQIADLKDQMNGRFDKLQAEISAIRTEQIVLRAAFAILVAGVASIVMKLCF